MHVRSRLRIFNSMSSTSYHSARQPGLDKSGATRIPTFPIFATCTASLPDGRLVSCCRVRLPARFMAPRSFAALLSCNMTVEVSLYFVVRAPSLTSKTCIESHSPSPFACTPARRQ